MKKRLLLVVALASATGGKAHAVGQWVLDGVANKPVATSTAATFTNATNGTDVSVAPQALTTTWVFNRDVNEEVPPNKDVVVTFTTTGGTLIVNATEGASVTAGINGKGTLRTSDVMLDKSARLSNAWVSSWSQGQRRQRVCGEHNRHFVKGLGRVSNSL